MIRLRRAPAPVPPRKVTALEYYGARLMPDYSGYWVYALGASTDGHVWYCGQSADLMRRLYDHQKANPDLFDSAQVYLIRVRDQLQADVRELELIDHYQPERNIAGRTAELRTRVHAHNRGRKSQSLDRSQVAD